MNQELQYFSVLDLQLELGHCLGSPPASACFRHIWCLKLCFEGLRKTDGAARHQHSRERVVAW